MTFPSRARWMTGSGDDSKLSQRILRMADGAVFGRPVAQFAGGVQPTTHGGSHGVVGDDDLEVTVVSGTEVSIAAGACVINGTSAVEQGVYLTYNGAAQSVELDAHESSQRIDLVGVQVKDDAEDSGGDTELVPAFVKGTAGSGTAPSAPAGFLVLAEVTVPANEGDVTVTDKRTYAAALGGILRCRSTTRPTGVALRAGLTIFELDTAQTYTWDGSVWRPLSGQWGASLQRNTNQSAAGSAETTVIWNVENVDTAGMWTSGSNLTVPSNGPGLWAITTRVQGASTWASGSHVKITAGGNSYGFEQGGSGAPSFYTGSLTVPLGAGSTISVSMVNGGSTQNMTALITAYRVG